MNRHEDFIRRLVQSNELNVFNLKMHELMSIASSHGYDNHQTVSYILDKCFVNCLYLPLQPGYKLPKGVDLVPVKQL